MTTDFGEQYREGLRLFNEEDFFECHEVFEELWSESQGDDRKFLQGLIQAAVALFHLEMRTSAARRSYITLRGNGSCFWVMNIWELRSRGF